MSGSAVSYLLVKALDPAVSVSSESSVSSVAASLPTNCLLDLSNLGLGSAELDRRRQILLQQASVAQQANACWRGKASRAGVARASPAAATHAGLPREAPCTPGRRVARPCCAPSQVRRHPRPRSATLPPSEGVSRLSLGARIALSVARPGAQPFILGQPPAACPHWFPHSCSGGRVSLVPVPASPLPSAPGGIHGHVRG